MGLAAQHLDEAAQRRLQQTVLERTLRQGSCGKLLWSVASQQLRMSQPVSCELS